MLGNWLFQAAGSPSKSSAPLVALVVLVLLQPQLAPLAVCYICVFGMAVCSVDGRPDDQYFTALLEKSDRRARFGMLTGTSGPLNVNSGTLVEEVAALVSLMGRSICIFSCRKTNSLLSSLSRPPAEKGTFKEVI